MRELKVKVKFRKDGVKMVNLSIPLHELTQILNTASLHCYDSLKEKNDHPYYEGMIKYTSGIMQLWDMQNQYRASLYEDPLLIPRTKKQRIKDVTEQKRVRKLIDGIVEEMIREAKEK